MACRIRGSPFVAVVEAEQRTERHREGDTTMSNTRSSTRRANVALWTVQALLAALFLFAGGMKLVLPIAAMTQQMPLPGAFLRFIGVAEVAGALGLILPALLRIRPELTPLAAAGLVGIMTGATVLTLQTEAAATAAIPLAVGILAASVAWGRRHFAPMLTPAA
jgi:uncharacterized membrane protein YphA (DoxX/SURF4 family)